jgi:hypothetical protein
VKLGDLVSNAIRALASVANDELTPPASVTKLLPTIGHSTITGFTINPTGDMSL